MTGWEWGMYACLEPVSWELFVQFVDRDDQAIELMITVGERFWRGVTEGPAPPRLLSSDKRCQTCPFRWTCHGEGLLTTSSINDENAETIEDSYLSKLIERRDLISTQRDEINQMMDENTQLIKDHLKKHRKVICGSRPVIWKLTERTRLDTAKLKQDAPDIYDKYSTQGQSEYFRVI
jgi:predicted phage-related endonuclease